MGSGGGACAVVPSTGRVAPWYLGITLGRWVALRKGAGPECPARQPGGTYAGPGRQAGIRPGLSACWAVWSVHGGT